MSRVVSVFAVTMVVAVFKIPIFVVIQVVRDTSGQAVSRFQGCAGSVFPCSGSCDSLIGFGFMFPLVHFFLRSKTSSMISKSLHWVQTVSTPLLGTQCPQAKWSRLSRLAPRRRSPAGRSRFGGHKSFNEKIYVIFCAVIYGVV